MTAIILESSLMIVLMIGFRKLCRNLISMRVMYGLWELVVLLMLPSGYIFGRNEQTIVLDLCSRGVSFLRNREFIRFDFSFIRIPWYLLVVWAIGSVLVFLWEFFVNFRFEKMLFENRERVPNENCPYPIYYVPDLQSSCIFKVKGKAGIYLKKEVCEDPEVYRTILSHELCHMKVRDLFWAKLRLVFVAVYWFNPLVWIAAVLSKEDCEMACDERTIALLKMKKSDYGKVLLDAVNTGMPRTRDGVFCAATTMVSSPKGFRIRIERLMARESNEWMRLLTGSAFVLGCIFLFSFGIVALSEEETIRQYVACSNVDNQRGMKKLSLYDDWDYFFPYKLDGEIVEIRKINDENDTKKYQVKMKNSYDDGLIRQEDHIVLLVKEQETGAWKIDWRKNIKKGW